MKFEVGQFFSLFKHLPFFNRTSLRGHMTISYVLVTLGSVLSFMTLAVIASGTLFSLFSDTFSDTLPDTFLATVQQQAQLYALNASVQGYGVALDPTSNFIPGHANTLVISAQARAEGSIPLPYISSNKSPDPTSIAVALLIAPDGYLVSSSYPLRYSTGVAVWSLPHMPVQAISQALAGHSSTGTEHFSSMRLGYAVEPVMSKNNQPIGALFLQVLAPSRGSIVAPLKSVLIINFLLLVLVTPVGVFFGWITTRGLVSRVKGLVVATTQFATGDYTQRFVSSRQDEIGHLEQQFNLMADQLSENIARRQQLAGQNARLEERSRISRELHDAISQDLFSLRMLADGLQEATRSGSSSADLRPHIAVLEQTTSSMTREMRALLLELRPSQLENLGLIGALQSLSHAYSVRLGITVTADLRPVKLTIKGEHALLRIAQEALANAARHSSASIISLSLSEQGAMARLIIVDNGGGFCQETESVQHGLGLHLMRERAEELGGTFDLQTVPEQGTRIVVCLLLEESCCD